MKATIGYVLGASLIFAGVGPAPAQIQVDRGDCANGVHLVAKDVRLSDVLKRLAEALEFELQFEGGGDPLVSIDDSRQAPELIAKLSPATSMIVTQARDPHCPPQFRIVKVWVLPHAAQNASPATAPPAPTARLIQAPPPPTPDQLDAMSRQRKEAYDAYVKKHGVPPPVPDGDVAQ